MFTVLLAAAIAGQLPTPQSPAADPPIAQPAAVTLALVAVQPAPQPQPQTGILVSSPPVWDRALAKLGAALTARAAHHQHPKVLTLVTVQPTTVQPVIVQPVAPAPAPPQQGGGGLPKPPPILQAVPVPTPSSQSEAAPPPPTVPSAGQPLLYIPHDSLVQKLFHR